MGPHKTNGIGLDDFNATSVLLWFLIKGPPGKFSNQFPR